MRNSVGTVDTVLLLGGRSEIGLAIVERLVTDGARTIVLAARDTHDETALGAGPQRLRTAGATAIHPLAFDAAATDSHSEVITTAARLAGDLDVVVDAFGMLGEQAIFDADPAAAATAVTVTFTGHVSANLAVAAQLRQQGHGTLVVLSSVAGVRVRRDNFVYGSAKAGLDGFAQGLDDALHGSGARVLVVRPGYVPTQMSAHVSPAPFPASTTQIAEAVAHGLRTGKRTVWVPRPLQAVFTGLRLLPRPLWRKIVR